MAGDGTTWVTWVGIGATDAGLEMTGVPPNSAPKPRPKAGFDMWAEWRSTAGLSISSLNSKGLFTAKHTEHRYGDAG